MRRLLLSVFIVGAFAGASCAHADTIENFTFTATFQGGHTAQGTIVIDVTNGLIQPSSFAVSLGGVVEDTLASYLQTQYGGYTDEYFSGTNGYGAPLLLPNYGVVGYTGGAICTVSSSCAGQTTSLGLPSGTVEHALTGSLSPEVTPPTAMTPEPSSVALFGTGILGALGFVRRKYSRA